MLDYLYLQSGVAYLSDLKAISTNHKILEELMRIDDAKFPLAEWNEAISYIFNRGVTFRTVGEAKEYVRKCCQK